MKHLLFSALFVLGALAVEAQAVRRVIAWSQQSMPGTVPVIHDERGNPVERPVSALYRYFLYLETRRGERIKILQVWINGKERSFTQEEMVKGPVSKEVAKDGLNMQPVLLAEGGFPTVPVTIQDAGHRGGAVPRAYRANKVVVRYQYRGRIFTAAGKAIKELPPVMNQ